MRPVYQTKFGGADAPPEEQGDCMRAALASVFEINLEDAPDFAGHISDGTWWDILTAWLAERGLGLVPVPPYRASERRFCTACTTRAQGLWGG